MVDRAYSVATTRESALATNKVLRNTYMLLSLTLLFSGATAAFAVMTNAPYMGLWTLLGYFDGVRPDRFYGLYPRAAAYGRT